LAWTQDGRERPARLDAISIDRTPPDEINAIVEVLVGRPPSNDEMDKVVGTLIVDRFRSAATRHPDNYDLIPPALSDDGDPCDVLIANRRSVVPGVLVALRQRGALKLRDVSRRRGEDHRSARAAPDAPLRERPQRAGFAQHRFRPLALFGLCCGPSIA